MRRYTRDGIGPYFLERVLCGDLEEVQLLVVKGQTMLIHQPPHIPARPPHHCCACVGTGVDVNYSNSTAMLYSVYANDLQMCKFLASKNCSLIANNYEVRLASRSCSCSASSLPLFFHS